MDCKDISTVGLPWVGGKKRSYENYVKYFPDKIDTLVDLFAGGGTISFSTPARETIANDIDHNLINLYEVLGGKEELARIYDYERSREHFKTAHDIIRNRCIYLDSMERAKYTVADIFMSFNKGRGSYSKGLDSKTQEKYREGVERNLESIRERVRDKAIRFVCGDALDLLEQYIENEKAFIFADPPYINSTIHGHVYYKQMLPDMQQEMLAFLLAKCKGKVMLCGYRDRNLANNLYDRQFRLAGGHCYKLFETKAFCEKVKLGEKKSGRVEYIWTNYGIEALKADEVDLSVMEAA